MEKKTKIYLIDGYNFIYRLFYAIPHFTLKDGTPINATFGMAKMIVSWYKEDKPDYLIFILDYKGKNIRHDLFEEYKGTRDRMPDDLKTQESMILSVLDAFGIPVVTLEGYEADDIIGTLAIQLKKDKNNDVYILSGDKDLYQFVDDNVAIYDTMKRKISHQKEAFEKFGVDSKYIVDYLAICGDTSDNIPGIPGFGPKKAQDLISKYGTLEEIYLHIDDITGKTKEILENNHDRAFMSKKLASIHTDLILPGYDLENHEFSKHNIFTPEAIDMLKRYEFKSLVPAMHQDKIKDFNTLGLEIVKVDSDQDIDLLEQKLEKAAKVSISTTGNSSFDLESVCFYFGEKEISCVSSSHLRLTSLLKKLMEIDIEVIGFDLKEDLKRIESFIKGNQVKIRSNADLNQSSLF